MKQIDAGGYFADELNIIVPFLLNPPGGIRSAPVKMQEYFPKSNWFAYLHNMVRHVLLIKLHSNFHISLGTPQIA